ncbi:hypothetical protein Golob_014569 [Gossypium lobatum]|uniref:DUF4283 domain-containing protein n=1 Tax=Gossypium lobatum TaxID=34289 RepID=A0A7J8LYI4_9ROSI|nr:hypothetical protein [Gossypium lobatum]
MLWLEMMESGDIDGFGGDEIFLLAEELIQLSVKSSMVEPNGKPSLICSIWTKKSYNHDSFKAQMKSIWKTKEKFEIQLVGQNLFLITFESEDDLEIVMEGVTFGGVLRSEISGEFCHLRIKLNVQKPLRRGLEIQKKGEANERNTENRNVNILKSGRKASWKRTEPMEVTRQYEAESKL